MKRFLFGVLIMVWALPAVSASVQITVKSYDTGLDQQPYFVLYLADNKGRFVKTLHIMGLKYKYHREMKGWFKNAVRNSEDLDALSGASLRDGASFSKNFFIDDDYILNNYQIIVESSSLEFENIRKEVVITLDKNTPNVTKTADFHTESVTVNIK